MCPDGYHLKSAKVLQEGNKSTNISISVQSMFINSFCGLYNVYYKFNYFWKEYLYVKEPTSEHNVAI